MGIKIRDKLVDMATGFEKLYMWWSFEFEFPELLQTRGGSLEVSKTGSGSSERVIGAVMGKMHLL